MNYNDMSIIELRQELKENSAKQFRLRVKEAALRTNQVDIEEELLKRAARLRQYEGANDDNSN